ncbi:MAG TPA: SpoIIE family protein phosphatase [Solirubrobacteraceae bacterium]|jgi:anti-sigma regulatory factor (Ser/Thr protein kinase)/putative methionine-R-sulfoxide reductase with GAF domain|nr:SpoIIE family protein phosphatase [Solirubrobacteraceae bacterium]
MASETNQEGRRLEPGAGQVVLSWAGSELAPSEQIRDLSRLSDPALSELGLEDFLDELLVRVRDVLEADTVAILLLDESSQELIARAAKGIEEEVEQGVRVPLGTGFAGRIAAERVPIFVADVDHADIMNPILREKGIRSLLGVPLIAEGEVLGVLHIGSLRPRTFGPEDLAILQVAAARAAPGIERARLFSVLQREHAVATLLQRSLLPKRLIGALGVSSAARYLPASDEVGGDWYDLFELPRGSLGVAIGDVVGHGLGAAALMGQLRTALHAYAMEGHSPVEALELVDRFVQSMPDDAMATAAYAVLDRERRVLRLASAGHLPPIVAGNGAARVLEVAPNAPLGAFAYVHSREHSIELEPGEILVLYTDGLIERPGVPLTQSMERLRALLAGADSAEHACELAVEALVPGEGRRDDVAIVALQLTAVPDELSLRVPAEPDVLAEVRRTLRRWLRDHGAGDHDVADITLAVSEACTNAVEHAYSPGPAHFELHARERDGGFEIVVRDDGRWRSPRGHNRRRGLTIIDTVMDSVQIDAGEQGTSVIMRRAAR